MKGLLLAGGHGTRLRPLTFTGNKHMLPIANKPMLIYGLEHLRNAGIKEIGIILGPIKEGVEQTLKDGSKYGVEITYIEQPEPKGLAHAIMMAKEFLDEEPFAMYLGDNLIKQGIAPLVKLFEENGSDCVVATTQVHNPGQYGVIVFDESGKAERFIEKPREFISDWALVGLYIFNRKVFDALRKIRPSRRGEYEITDTIQVLLQGGARVDVQRVQGWWKDTGKPEDLLEANQLVLNDIEAVNDGTVNGEVGIIGNVAVGVGSVLNGKSTILGPVVIGSHCKIGPNSWIGPYTSIGDGVILTNTEIENTIVMGNTRIECGGRIVDSIIGRDVEILSCGQSLPRGHRLILGDSSKVSL